MPEYVNMTIHDTIIPTTEYPPMFKTKSVKVTGKYLGLSAQCKLSIIDFATIFNNFNDFYFMGKSTILNNYYQILLRQ